MRMYVGISTTEYGNFMPCESKLDTHTSAEKISESLYCGNGRSGCDWSKIEAKANELVRKLVRTVTGREITDSELEEFNGYRNSVIVKASSEFSTRCGIAGTGYVLIHLDNG